MLARASIICSKFWAKRRRSRGSTAHSRISKTLPSRAERGTSHDFARSGKLSCVTDHRVGGPSSSARLRMTRELLLRFFRPCVLECDRPVPHLFIVRRIRIEREITESLELITLFRPRIGKGWLAFRGHHFARIGIDKGFEIANRACRAGAHGGGGIGLRNGEEPVI